MQPFLDKVASHLMDTYANRIDEMCIVLPNRRSGLFLKKYLSKKIDKPILLPAIYSIEDIVLELSGFRLIDSLALLFELYTVHRNIEKEQAQTFDDFLHWGKALLRDFNEIDAYLINPQRLFSHLSEAKAIAVWNLEQQPLTPFEKNYLSFFTSLISYYSSLTESLIEKKLAYEGLAARKLSESLPEIIDKIKWFKILFCGFNALTKAEEHIIHYLVSNSKAEVLWDADGYYVDNPAQEAGHFFREYIKSRKFGDFRWKGDDLQHDEKQITIIGVPQNVGQVKIAGQIINDIKNVKTDLQNTAVVLSKEDLLIPLLNSLPADIGDFNVTMGYPLTFTPVYDLIESIFTMHENAERFYNLHAASQWKYYYKDAFKILNHPYIMALSDDPSKLRESISLLQNTFKVFFTDDELEAIFVSENPGYSSVVSLIFQNWEKQVNSALACFRALLEGLRDRLIADKPTDRRSTIELEYVFNFAKIFRRIKSLIESYGLITNTYTLRNVFKQIVAGTAIPFYGEPLKGLQVMGMLETRTLDFENIVLLSVNEDILPQAKTYNTFIPFDIRKTFGLPTYRDSNAIYAYHFYRLLQRSRNIFLIYNTEPDELGGGDKSRFINQIINELPLKNKQISITEKLLNIPPEKDKRNFVIAIEKDGGIIKKLLEKARNGLAPSALNAFRKCSLQFYFREIAGLAEAEEVEETIESATLGQVVHDIMYVFYKPFLDQPLTPDAIHQMMEGVDEQTRISFNRHYHGGDIRYGRNLLVANVARIFINNLLQAEKQFVESNQKTGLDTVIRFLEAWFDADISIKSGEDAIRVKLKGKFDRIDQVGDTWRIIDYKTGSVVESNLRIKNFEELRSDPGADFSIQLLMYAFIFLQSNPGITDDVLSGILSFRKHSQGLIEVELPDNGSISIQSLKAFEEVLINILEDLFNEKIPFSQTSDRNICKYCPFIGICFR